MESESVLISNVVKALGKDADAKKDLVEGFFGEEIENMFEGWGKSSLATRDMFGLLFERVRPYLKNKTINNAIGSLLGFYIATKLRVPEQAKLALRMLVRAAINGLGEAASEWTPQQVDTHLAKKIAENATKMAVPMSSSDSVGYVIVGAPYVHAHKLCGSLLTSKDQLRRARPRSIEKKGKGGATVETIYDDPEMVEGDFVELCVITMGGACPHCTPSHLRYLLSPIATALHETSAPPPAATKPEQGGVVTTAKSAVVGTAKYISETIKTVVEEMGDMLRPIRASKKRYNALLAERQKEYPNAPPPPTFSTMERWRMGWTFAFLRVVAVLALFIVVPGITFLVISG